MAQWFLYLILFLTFISIIGLCVRTSMCVHVHGQASHSAYVVVRGQQPCGTLYVGSRNKLRT